MYYKHGDKAFGFYLSQIQKLKEYGENSQVKQDDTLRQNIKKDVHLGSISGGTDVVGVINICNINDKLLEKHLKYLSWNVKIVGHH